MTVKASILKGKYLDSVKLMLISKALSGLDGVQEAVAIMATKENREILRSTNMLVPEVDAAQESDIVVVVKADNDVSAEQAIVTANEMMHHPSKAGNESNLKILNQKQAVQKLGRADLCLISVAGKYAAAEADKALDLGMHVMLFSDNVSLEDELALKQKAVGKGLLMMGPDCGTAIINGIPLAFANSVPRGKIGIVSASGTGLQEISSGIANMGGGVSQAFGTGGRDGKMEIGGLMLTSCLEYLIADDETKVIVLMGKTPAKEILGKLWKLLGTTRKPVIVNFLKPLDLPAQANLLYVTSLAESAQYACEAAGYSHIKGVKTNSYAVPKLNGQYLRGLYSGGTLCAEAIQIYLRNFGHEPFSNVGSDPNYILRDSWQTEKDSLIDLGADEFTVGRPHPMIEYSLRIKKMKMEAANPQVGIILLDVVLGYGAHNDPATELVPAIKQFRSGLITICNVLGTSGDPQDRTKQIEALKAAGVYVFATHHEACEFACTCLKMQRGME